MHLIAGLGNPGPDHAGNRHNVGFMAADAIARRHGLSPWREKFGALIADGQADGERLLVLKPQGYMNRSGEAVAAALNFYKLGPGDLSVIYDEIDLTPGKLKVKTGGGSGGHNGIRSIDAHLGPDYRRVRIGVGHPGHKDLVNRHVLSDFAKADRDWLEPLLTAIADNAALLARSDEANFMNRCALALRDGVETFNDHTSEAPSAPASPARKESRREGPLADTLKRLFNRGS